MSSGVDVERPATGAGGDADAPSAGRPEAPEEPHVRLAALLCEQMAAAAAGGGGDGPKCDPLDMLYRPARPPPPPHGYKLPADAADYTGDDLMTPAAADGFKWREEQSEESGDLAEIPMRDTVSIEMTGDVARSASLFRADVRAELLQRAEDERRAEAVRQERATLLALLRRHDVVDDFQVTFYRDVEEKYALRASDKGGTVTYKPRMKEHISVRRRLARRIVDVKRKRDSSESPERDDMPSSSNEQPRGKKRQMADNMFGELMPPPAKKPTLDGKLGGTNKVKRKIIRANKVDHADDERKKAKTSVNSSDIFAKLMSDTQIRGPQIRPADRIAIEAERAAKAAAAPARVEDRADALASLGLAPGVRIMEPSPVQHYVNELNGFTAELRKRGVLGETAFPMEEDAVRYAAEISFEYAGKHYGSLKLPIDLNFDLAFNKSYSQSARKTKVHLFSCMSSKALKTCLKSEVAPPAGDDCLSIDESVNSPRFAMANGGRGFSSHREERHAYMRPKANEPRQKSRVEVDVGSSEAAMQLDRFVTASVNDESVLSWSLLHAATIDGYPALRMASGGRVELHAAYADYARLAAAVATARRPYDLYTWSMFVTFTTGVAVGHFVKWRHDYVLRKRKFGRYQPITDGGKALLNDVRSNGGPASVHSMQYQNAAHRPSPSSSSTPFDVRSTPYNGSV